MTTVIPERTVSYPGIDERPNNPKAVDLIDSLLHIAKELPDEEVEHRFAVLVSGAQRLGLPKYADQGRIDEYAEVVPGADELIERIHSTADEVLLTQDGFSDESAVLLVNNLGIAADLTHDKEILEKTLDAINNTSDYSLLDLKRALELARDRDMLFYRAYRDIQNGKHALSIAAKSMPMSQRPDFDETDPLSQWLSKREVEMPRHHTWVQQREARELQALQNDVTKN